MNTDTRHLPALWRRVLALCLTLSLCLSMLPGYAFAAQTDADEPGAENLGAFSDETATEAETEAETEQVTETETEQGTEAAPTEALSDTAPGADADGADETGNAEELPAFVAELDLSDSAALANATFSFDEDVLTVTGEGELDLTGVEEAGDIDAVTRVVLSSGITSIPEDALTVFANLSTVEILSSVSLDFGEKSDTLDPGETAIYRFTATHPGRYDFSFADNSGDITMTVREANWAASATDLSESEPFYDQVMAEEEFCYLVLHNSAGETRDVTVSVSGYQAEGALTPDGTAESVTLAAGQTACFSFTTNDTDSEYKLLLDPEGTELEAVIYSADWTDSFNSEEGIVTLEQSSDYYLCLINPGEEEAAVNVSLSPNRVELDGELTLENTPYAAEIPAKGAKNYSFTATDEGNYVFYTTGDADTSGYVYEQDIGSEPIEGEPNFRMVVYLTEEETITLQVTNDSDEDATITIHAVRQDSVDTSGSCGEGVEWSLDVDNVTLTITGSGEITSHPWDNLYNCIEYLVIGDGVTGICEGAFTSCVSLQAAHIPGSVTAIGQAEFVDGVELSCPEHSFAHLYAVENGFAVSHDGFDPMDVPALPGEPFALAAGHHVLYSFTPDEDKAYTITAEGLTITLWDGGENINGEGGNVITAELTADTPCYIDLYNRNGDGPFSVSVGSKPTGGDCGESATWDFSDGTLTLSGSGAVTTSPWGTHYADEIDAVEVADGITALPANAFSGCTSLTEAVLPASVTAIGDQAFSTYDADSDGYVNLPVTITAPANTAAHLFALDNGFDFTPDGAETLTPFGSEQTMTLGASEAKLYSFTPNAAGKYIFTSGSDNSKPSLKITLWDGTTRMTTEDGFDPAECELAADKTYLVGICRDILGDGSLEYTVTATTTPTGGEGWSYDRSTKTLTLSGEGAVSEKPWDEYYRDDVKKVDIGSGITAVGARLFANCGSLEEVTLAGSVTTIGANAFYNCAKLNSIDLSHVSAIGAQAFAGCTSLTDVNIAVYDAAIGENAFSHGNPMEPMDVTIHALPHSAAALYAKDKGHSFEADKLSVTDKHIAVSIPALTYNGKAQTAEVSVSITDAKGAVIRLTAGEDYTLSGNATQTGAGSYPITVTGKGDYEDSTSATFTIQTLTLSSDAVTIALSGADPVYDGTAQEPAVTVTLRDGTVLDSENYDLSYSNNRDAGSAAGVTASFTKNCDGSAAGTFTIQPLQAVLSWDNLNLTYNGSEQAPTATVSNLVEGDTCTVTVSGATNASDTPYTGVATALSNPNYKLPAEVDCMQSFSIGKAPGTEESGYAVPSNLSAGYGETLSAVSLDGGWAWDAPDTVLNAVGVQSFAATYTPADESNYEAVRTTLRVDVGQQTASADLLDIAIPDHAVYTGSDQPNVVTARAKEGVSGLGTLTVRYFRNDEEVTPKNAGTYTFKVDVADGTNYHGALLSGEDWTVTIAPKPVTVSGITASGKVYDGEDNAELNCNGAVFKGLASGDTLTISASGRFTDVNAGEQTVSITLGALDGASKDNYVLAETGSQTTATATISPRPITVKADDQSSVYGASIVSPLTFTIVDSNLVGEDSPDSLDLSAGTEATAQSSVGEYEIVLTQGAGANTNYAVTLDKGVYTITKADQTLRVEAEEMYIGTTQQLSVSGHQTEGLTYSTGNAAIATVSDTGLVTAVSAGTVTITVTAPEDTNYNEATGSVEITVSAKRSIGDAEITIPSVTYNGTEQTAQITVKLGEQELTEGADYTVSGTTTATNAGTYDITITGACSYEGSKTATFTISKANITPKVALKGWVYGQTAQNPSVSGNTGNGKVSYTYAKSGSTSFGAKPTNAGSYTVKATIAATTNYNGGTATANFTISKANQTVTATKTGATIEMGKTVTITGKGQGTITYTTGNKKIATVTSKGVIKGIIPGTVKVTIKAAGNGNYNSATTTVTIKVVCPKPALSKLTNSKAGTMTVKWAKKAGVTGYQIQYSTTKSFKKGVKTVTVKGANATSKAIGKLTKGKIYYVRMRTYYKNSKTVSAWSAVKSVKIGK